MKRTRYSSSFWLLTIAFALALFAPRSAMAHAVLVSSSPAAHATIQEHNVVVQLKFNSRIDGAHSRLYLVHPDGKVETLTLTEQNTPDALAAQGVKLDTGAYTIRWQALAADGHITRGEIAFTVQ
jgi:hypothetical protein